MSFDTQEPPKPYSTLTLVGQPVKSAAPAEPAVSENLPTKLASLREAMDEFERAWSRFSADPFEVRR